MCFSGFVCFSVWSYFAVAHMLNLVFGAFDLVVLFGDFVRLVVSVMFGLV